MLREFFESPSATEEALDLYDRFAQKNRGWLVDHKFDLYDAARGAWDEASSDRQRDGFAKLMKGLRSYWRIGRPTGLASDNEILAEVTRCRTIRDITCITANDDRVIQAVWQLRNIKSTRTAWVSPMAMSKILHFVNPTVFPIYDTAVIEKLVLSRFRDEWRDFEPVVSLTQMPLHTGAIFYLKYVWWARSHILIAREQTMTIFAEWVLRHIQADHPARDVVSTLDAAAFEMIAIGAAHQ